jgi:O-antigen ligase
LLLSCSLLLFAIPEAVKGARRALVLAAGLAVALNIYEVTHPLAFSDVLGRSAGLYVNPNRAALALVVAFVLSVDVLPPRARGLYLLAIWVGVVPTFSRSAVAILAGVTAWTFLSGRVPFGRAAWVSAAVLVPVLVVVVSGLLPLVEDNQVLNPDTSSRLDLVFTDPNTVSRFEVAERALQMISSHPLIGSGLGAGQNLVDGQGAHNAYLAYAVDHGLFGLLLVLSLLALLARRGKISLVFAVTLAAAAFFTHNLFDEQFFIVGIALAAAIEQPGSDLGGAAIPDLDPSERGG